MKDGTSTFISSSLQLLIAFLFNAIVNLILENYLCFNDYAIISMILNNKQKVTAGHSVRSTNFTHRFLQVLQPPVAISTAQQHRQPLMVTDDGCTRQCTLQIVAISMLLSLITIAPFQLSTRQLRKPE